MKQRYEAPTSDNRYYLRPEAGGYNQCIAISGGSVLPNCCGYAFGRFMEAGGVKSCKLSTSHAENWFGFTADGYERGQTPKPGAVMCWRGGNPGDTSDGYGHVAVVEQVNADGSVVCSMSNYPIDGKKLPYWERKTYYKPYNTSTGLIFQGFIYNPGTEKKVKPITLKDGYQTVEVSGKTAHLYHQKDEVLVVIADINGKKRDIKDFKLPGYKIRAAVNCSFFDMSGTQEYFGRVQGYRTDTGEIVDDRPPAPAEQGKSGDKPYIDYVITPDGKVVTGDLFSWDLPNNKGDLVGFSPAGVQILDGQSVNKYSPEVGYSKINSPHHMTALAKSSDGKWNLIVIPEDITAIPALQTWGLESGFIELCILDGGGSSQMIVNGGAVVYTGRYIPVILALVVPEGETPAEKPETPSEIDETPIEKPEEDGEKPTDNEKEPETTPGINWAQKLSSRKLWIAIISIIVGAMIKFGLPDTYANQVTSALLVLLPAVAYIIAEAIIDLARARGKDTTILEQIAQAFLKVMGESDDEHE